MQGNLGMDYITANMTFDNVTSMIPPIRENNAVQRALSYAITAVLGVVMVGMGCGVEFEKLKKHIKKPTGILVGLVCQFAIMPATAFALAKIAQMEDIETLALFLIGSCPGGTISNVATYYTSGDIGLSVSMTTVSMTLAFGIMPLLLYIYSFGFGSNLTIPFSTIGITLASMIVPIVIGICIRIKYPEQAKKIIKVLFSVGLLAIIAVTIAGLVFFGSEISFTTGQLVTGAVFPGIGMILGYALSSLISLIPNLHLGHKQRITIAIETGIQSTQIAGAIVLLSFPYEQAIPMFMFPVAYYISQIIWTLLVVIAYRIYKCRFPSKIDENEIKEEDVTSYSLSGEKNNAFTRQLPSDTEQGNKLEENDIKL